MKRKITSFLLYISVFLVTGGVCFLPVFCLSSSAEESSGFQISNTPNDSYFKYQWYLNKIKATRAWDHIKQSPEVTIAVIDTGIQTDHPDLKDNIWRNGDEIPDNQKDDDNNGFIDDVNGWDFVHNDPDPSPSFDREFSRSGVSHGTIVSGVAAAAGDNDMGITGVTWQTSIMPLRVLNDTGEGGANGVIRAIDYAIANGADIINLSFVGPGRSDSMHEAILRAHKAGVIVVAAAGNEKSAGHGYDLDRNPMYPVCYDSEYGEDVIIGVGATDPLDQKADFSSYGKCVDIMAPGSSVFSTVTYNPNKQMEDGGYLDKKYDGFWSGTSMAAPMVSGTLALIKAANPQLNYKQVKQVLLSSTDNIDKLNPRFFGEIGAGRLNVSKSVERALELLNSRKIKLLLSPQSHRSSQVQISDYNSEVVRDLEAFPFSFAGGINNIGADVDGDGTQEIIVGAGSGGGPQLRIFSFQGELRNQFFAYNPYFRGGVNVASGDINGDGRDEIITGAGPGGGPHIRVFNGQGDILLQFFAYDQDFRGGVNVASGDINGDGRDEIITGAGPGGGPHIRVFNGSGHVKGQFFAYAPSFRGGVRVALGNVDQGGETNQEEIITAPQSRGGPHIRVFNNKMRVINQFFAYNPSFRGGVNITSGDMNQDGVAEVITGAGPGGGPHVRYFNLNGEIINSFYAYDKDFDGGVNVGIINIK